MILPPCHLARASPLPLDVGYLFFSGIRHSPVDSCSAASCIFGVLAEDVEKAMATPSSTLAWKTPWAEEPGRLHGVAVHGVATSRTRLSDFTFTFHVHALEKEMANHASVLPWRIPWTEKTDGLQPVGLHRIGHN